MERVLVVGAGVIGAAGIILSWGCADDVLERSPRTRWPDMPR